MNVSLRPLEDRDLDTIYQQVTDPEAIRMAAFTAEDQTDRRAFLNRMSRLRANDPAPRLNRCGVVWARLDSNQGPTDYESAALTS